MNRTKSFNCEVMHGKLKDMIANVFEIRLSCLPYRCSKMTGITVTIEKAVLLRRLPIEKAVHFVNQSPCLSKPVFNLCPNLPPKHCFWDLRRIKLQFISSPELLGVQSDGVRIFLSGQWQVMCLQNGGKLVFGCY